MPGSGKSSIGRRVARAAGLPFVDVDTEIELSAGRPIPDIFATDGETGFRDLETLVLRGILESPEPSVVATGGGAVLRAENRALMRANGVVVWLRATPATLHARVGDGQSRPLLAGDPLGNLTRLLDERGAAYAEAAHEIVDVDRLPFHEITARVQAAAIAGAER